MIRELRHQEIFQTVIAVISRTVTHIGVVGKLVLIAKTCRQLVVTGEEGEVIGNVRNLVLHTVVVGEQLVTGAHVRFQNLVSILVLACHDVDEAGKEKNWCRACPLYWCR